MPHHLADDLFTVDHVLSPIECAALIERAEALGFEHAAVRMPSGPQMRTDIRDNDRVEWEDDPLASMLWQRCYSILPKLAGASPVGLDSHFRFYRYDVGQRFKAHKDGSVVKNTTEQSRLSFLVYLNADLVGGETVFYAHERVAGVRPVVARIQPEVGLGLFFRHEWWHEGAPLMQGRKYVLRTDVYYRSIV